MMATTVGASTAADAMLDRIRSEYLEMPDLSLTASQAERLWRIAIEECEALLEELVAQHFLRQTRSGAFVRS